MRTPERYRTADGRTRFKVRFRLEKRQTSETFDTEREATDFCKWIDALGPQGALDRLYAGDQVVAVPSLEQVAFDHIRLLTGIEDGTRLGYERLWRRTWSPLVGHLSADALTPDDVRAAINQLAERYKRKSLENQRGLLAGVVSRCIELGYLTKSPIKSVRLPEGRRVELAQHLETEDGDDGEMVCLTHDEWEVLYASVDEHYRPFVRFLVGTGCRWGEAVVLRPADFDLQAGNVRIRRALKWSGDGNRKVGPPKTRKGRRTIKLPAEVIEDVRPLVARRGGLVFSAPRGGMISHRTFWSKNWRPALWRAQICDEHRPTCQCGTGEPQRCKQHQALPPPCGCPGTLGQGPRIHDMRHTHASWLLAAGTPIHVVQARLGHESIQTTVDTYSHLLPDAQVAAAAAADLAFSARLPEHTVRLRAARTALDQLPADELVKLLGEYSDLLHAIPAPVVEGQVV